LRLAKALAEKFGNFLHPNFAKNPSFVPHIAQKIQVSFPISLKSKDVHLTSKESVSPLQSWKTFAESHYPLFPSQKRNNEKQLREGGQKALLGGPCSSHDASYSIAENCKTNSHRLNVETMREVRES